MSKVRRNILYNLVGQLLLLTLSFVSARYIYRGLGQDVLGIVYFVAMLNSALAGVLELGLAATVVKEVAAHHEDEPDYILRFIRVGVLYFGAVFLLVALTQVALAPVLLSDWLMLEGLSHDEGVLMLRILGPAAFLAFPQTFFASIFRGLQRMGVINSIDVIVMVFQQAGVVLLIVQGYTLLPVVLWIAGSYVLRLSSYVVLTARVFGVVALIPRHDGTVIRRNAAFASRMVGTSVLGMVHSQGDKLVVSALLPVAQVGWYGLAYGAVLKGSRVTVAVATAAFPRLTELVKSSGPDSEALRSLYHRLQSLMRFGLLPIFAGVPFVAPPVFAFVLDAQASEALWLPSTLLALGFYMQGTVNIPAFMALSMERPDIGLRQNVYALVVIFPLTVALIATWGLVGVALAWIVYQLFAYAYGVRRVYRECLGLRARVFYVEVLYVLSLAAVSYGPGGWWLVNNPDFSLPAGLLAYTLSTALFALGLWLSGGQELRQDLRSMLGLLPFRRGASAP